MTVFLIGGGWSDEQVPAVYGGFVKAAAERSPRPSPRIRLVVMGTDDEALEYHDKFLHALSLAGVNDVLVERVPEGSPCPTEALDDIDGLLVGGGTTPDYHASLRDLYPRIRDLVADGLPYAGFSAGAAIAARQAVIGGWKLDGVGITHEDNGEDLEDLTVVDGIGLVDGAVDVHAAQWGNLSRLLAAVGAGKVDHGVALDECTTLEIDGDQRRTSGAGAVWTMTRSGDSVSVIRSQA